MFFSHSAIFVNGRSSLSMFCRLKYAYITVLVSSCCISGSLLESTCIIGGIVLTQDKNRRIIKGNVLVRGDTIESVGRESDKSGRVIDASGSIVMPGLINMHSHVGMAPLRGRLTGTADLGEFLAETSRFDSRNGKELLEASSLIGIVEMLRTGTTAFLDLYYSEDIVARNAKMAGIRANLAWVILDKEYTTQKGVPLKNAEDFVRRYTGEELVRPMFGLQGVYVCSEETIGRTMELSDKYDTNVHMHLSETRKEVDDNMKKHGMPPVEYLWNRGFLSKRMIAAHCVWLEEREMTAMAESGATAVYNPVSNMKLGSGKANIMGMLQKKINITIGTDSVASNDSLDIFGTMKSGALESGVTPQMMLDFASVNAAKALGTNSGSIEQGKKADIIVVDGKSAGMVPTLAENAVSNLVYSACGRDVSLCIVDGNIIMRDGTLVGRELSRAYEKSLERITGFA